ncbi:F-box/LRR-repeat protein 6 [Ischnura elegans]|uniref:F-box/LRR-repeat protein 6 n=1 Tax=Ischnura elegans TaxID=197161 RepID=UPI001ED87F14|nr:F-box/LRR-repeat protein 6 [Ischnura elegans]
MDESEGTVIPIEVPSMATLSHSSPPLKPSMNPMVQVSPSGVSNYDVQVNCISWGSGTPPQSGDPLGIVSPSECGLEHMGRDEKSFSLDSMLLEQSQQEAEMSKRSESETDTDQRVSLSSGSSARHTGAGDSPEVTSTVEVAGAPEPPLGSPPGEAEVTEEGSASFSKCSQSSQHDENCTCNLCSQSLGVTSVDDGEVGRLSAVAERPTRRRRGRRRKREASSPSPENQRIRSKSRPGVTYRSQISPGQNGIKLRIRKASPGGGSAPHSGRGRGGGGGTRKGRRKAGGRAESSGAADDGVKGSGDTEPAEQSAWGSKLPKDFLCNVFWMVTREEGCVPFMFRMSQVCHLWRDVALTPKLWHSLDLSSPLIEDRVKSDQLRLHWLLQNRCALTQELGLGGWKVSGIPAALEEIATNCPELRGINLSSWTRLGSDSLRSLVEACPQLSRIDISGINMESNNPRSAVSLSSLLSLTEFMGERLTQLILASNKLAGLSQIVIAIATHCPCLEVLDLSNVRTLAHTTAPIAIERLQEGCQRLRVLRITNSQVSLAQATLKEQASSPGFPNLEELSIAVDGRGCSQVPVVDNSSLERILKTSHQLRLLDVRGCTRVSDSSLVRVPAWDLEHLFLSGCYATRPTGGDGLELIARKWVHSLVEVDLAWSTATDALDAAIYALADKEYQSPLRVLNLCGSSVSLGPIQALLNSCPHLCSLNLSSCRALPRGMKRLYQSAAEIDSLRASIRGEQRNAEEEATPSEEPAVNTDGNIGEEGMSSPA